MPLAGTFIDDGTYNLRDLDANVLVAKVHVEKAADDAAGGRGYIIHYALVKGALGEQGWGIYSKPTLTNGRRWKWEGTDETLGTFLNWMNARKANIRYVMQGVREQDAVP